ncbi:MAG TPA: hypothetical protein VGS79_24020 [Puia sp.]|nr:hypothetical protein [Puia sp.]
MSADEFQEIWKEYDRRLERSLSLSRRLFTDLQQQKVGAELRPVLRYRVVTIVVGIVWLLLMAFCLYVVRRQPVMAISFGAFCVCTIIGVAGAIRDVSVIRTVEFSDNVVETQRKLVKMQSTMLRDIRLAWLQLPFWASFFVSNGMIRAGGPAFFFVEVPVFLCLAGLAIFLYVNITAENVRKKMWVAAMVRGAGSRRLARALALLKELEEFEKES